MVKRVVICLDGTWNEEGQTDSGVETKTNVRKLFEALDNGTDQVARYLTGVGTKKFEKVSGGALGWGLFDQIKDGYRWLVQNFDPGDQICIFGFSRGAYSARSLAGMILRCGVLKEDNENDQLTVPTGALDLLTTEQDDRLKPDAATKVFAVYKHANKVENRPAVEAFKRQYCHDTGIRMVGVWDTVGALGVPEALLIPALRREDQTLKQELFGFLDTSLSPRVDAAYHALAIDERRKPFLPTLWTDAPDRNPRINLAGSNVEQVWFAGAHSNVGGGYADIGLSEITLKWMVTRSQLNGLRFAQAQWDAIAPDFKGKRRDSLKEFLELNAAHSDKKALLASLTKVLNVAIDKIEQKTVATDREIADGSCVHESVNARLRETSVAEPAGPSAYQPAASLNLVDKGGVRQINGGKFRVVR